VNCGGVVFSGVRGDSPQSAFGPSSDRMRPIVFQRPQEKDSGDSHFDAPWDGSDGILAG